MSDNRENGEAKEILNDDADNNKVDTDSTDTDDDAGRTYYYENGVMYEEVTVSERSDNE